MSLKEKLAAGEFVTLVEMEPPKGVNVANFLNQAARVRGKVDAFVVPEMANAVMKMSSLGGCMLLAGKGLPTVMQVCCRDRNRLALQADLLAAHALGVENIMAVEGANPSLGDHHKARPVYDLELVELLEVIGKLQGGRDMSGVELDGAPSFTLGSTVNPGAAVSMAKQMEELDRLAEAGAEFFITPPLFSLDAFEPFRKQLGRRGAKIIPTVLVLKSVGMARAIGLHMKHVQIPPALVERLKKAPDRIPECLQIARELVAQVRQAGYAGVMVSPLGWEDKLPQILEGGP